MTRAYDYVAQKWISGPEAEVELRRQHQESLDCLSGPDGPQYARYTGLTEARRLELIALFTAELAKCICGGRRSELTHFADCPKA